MEKNDNLWEKQFQEKFKEIYQEYKGLIKIISSGDGKSEEFKKASRRISEIESIIKLKEKLDTITSKIRETKKMIEEEEDNQLKELANEELIFLKKREEEIKKSLTEIFLPKNPEDEKNAIVEIRPGIGGEESCLFVRDLFRMYTKYCDKKGYKIEIFNSQVSALGGFKEIIFLVKGIGAYSDFKYESGVHRVQRVPETETGGRIHTSAATVAVFPEVEEEKVKIEMKDLKIETFRAGGHGGQNVNKVASAVRITHLPTGIVVNCQDERSQIQNRARALKILRARLQYLMEQQKRDKIDKERKQQVKTGERSEKIRTYNFPQNRLTDHRINLTLYKLDDIMEGELEEILKNLKSAELKK